MSHVREWLSNVAFHVWFPVGFAVLILAAFLLQDRTPTPPEPPPPITDADRVRVLLKALPYILVERGMARSPDLRLPDGRLRLSSQRLDSLPLPRIEGIEYALLSPDTLQVLADRQGEAVSFLQFAQVRFEGRQAEILITHEIAHPVQNEIEFTCTGGIGVTSRRQSDGEWTPHHETVTFH